ncbi:MAG TPA: response regulator [Polyangiaceae bacterium]|jgi:signal transduction histidine kinase|nr:response regulator [Polyangiaceae bacterium]
MVSVATPLADRPIAPRLLLVEDDDDLLDAVSTVLGEAGYVVEACRNGREALERIREAPVDLVVLDLMMPVMNGWEFRASQRADQSIADIPVVVMTADASAKAAAIHADSYVKKPFGAPELLGEVERVLREHERSRLTKGSEDAERLALLGSIAAGLGHEINNPLLFAMGNLEMLEEALPHLREDFTSLRREGAGGLPPDLIERFNERLVDLMDVLRDGRAGVERVRHIVRNLQSLSRSVDDRKKRVDLKRVIETSLAVASSQTNRRAKLVLSLAPVPGVWGSEARLVQVFVNLLVNAAQSIQKGSEDANEIRITTRHEAYRAIVEIDDTGVGMSEALKGRIFEPFFTTKGQGEGTGLGLAICREIVNAHGGEIEVSSEIGKGSTFRVCLPVQSGDPSTRRRPSVWPAPIGRPLVEPGTPKARCRVWIVDDEILVAHAVARMLHDAHDPLVPRGPFDVLERLRNGETFDALICDLMMPEMTGMELGERIAAEWPELSERVVFISGGAFTPKAQEFLRNAKSRFLEKPFEADVLRALVERVGKKSAEAHAASRS